MELDQIVCSDALDYLRTLPDECVNCVVTSPPYFGLRDYGTATWDGGDLNCQHSVGNQVSDNKWAGAITTGMRPGADAWHCRKCGAVRIDRQIGLEHTPALYVQALVELFREIKRVLRKDGTVWLNLGDGYAGSGPGNKKGDFSSSGLHGAKTSEKYRETLTKSVQTVVDKTHLGIKSKNLMMIPARVALALQDDGWYLRAEIVWSKGNSMPESVRDRVTRSHEMVYLLTRSAHYWYDADAIKEPAKESSVARIQQANFVNQMGGDKDYGKTGVNSSRSMRKTLENWAKQDEPVMMSNARSVWDINTAPTPFAHFATMPPELVRRCVLAGCPDKVCFECGAPYTRLRQRTGHVNRREAAHVPGNSDTKVDSTGWQPVSVATGQWQPTCACNAPVSAGIVLDPFMGSGTTALVSRARGRHYLGCDLNAEYVALARDRLRQPFEQHHIAPNNDLSELPMFKDLK